MAAPLQHVARMSVEEVLLLAVLGMPQALVVELGRGAKTTHCDVGAGGRLAIDVCTVGVASIRVEETALVIVLVLMVLDTAMLGTAVEFVVLVVLWYRYGVAIMLSTWCMSMRCFLDSRVNFEA